MYKLRAKLDEKDASRRKANAVLQRQSSLSAPRPQVYFPSHYKILFQLHPLNKPQTPRACTDTPSNVSTFIIIVYFTITHSPLLQLAHPCPEYHLQPSQVQRIVQVRDSPTYTAYFLITTGQPMQVVSIRRVIVPSLI